MARWAKMPKLLFAIMTLFVVLCLITGRVEAHAILLKSSPAANAAISGPSVPLLFQYNSRIDRGRSVLTITYPDKSQKVLPITADGPEDTLASKLDLPPGHYSVRWQVLAIDGHITRGDVPFDVTAPN